MKEFGKKGGSDSSTAECAADGRSEMGRCDLRGREGGVSMGEEKEDFPPPSSKFDFDWDWCDDSRFSYEALLGFG